MPKKSSQTLAVGYVKKLERPNFLQLAAFTIGIPIMLPVGLAVSGLGTRAAVLCYSNRNEASVPLTAPLSDGLFNVPLNLRSLMS